MILFILAVAGSALILTQSAIFAPLRARLNELASPMTIEDYGEYGVVKVKAAGVAAVFAVLAKLASCPMCSGFWLGIAWWLALDWPGFTPRAIAPLLAHGAAGSIVSAVGVALWLTLIEAQNMGAMWRYLNQPEEGGDS